LPIIGRSTTTTTTPILMASPIPPDPYKALGVPKNASLATIKSAHRKLVLICHPDKFPDESIKAQKADEFHQVQQAYEILSDETKKQRYDERVKLAELRAELMRSDRCPPRRMASEFSPRTAGPTTFEMRGNVIVEERVPRPRAYDDEYLHKYDDPRSSHRVYDDRSDYPSPKLHSPRAQEDKRRARERDEERERERRYEEDERVYRQRRERERERAAEKAYRSEAKKTRDKARRRNSDTKHQSAHVEDDTDTDSDSTLQYHTRRVTEPRRKLDDRRRKEREDTKFLESEDEQTRNVAEYITKTGSRPPLDPVSRRPSSTKFPSANLRQAPPPPPPPPSPPLSLDTARRSAAPRRPRESSRTRSSGKDRRPPEIVEPASRPEAFRPKMPTHTSDPVHIRTPPSSPRNATISRAATMEPQRDEPKHPTLPRSATSPLAGMSSPREREPLRSSRLRNTETHEAGYSSPEHTVSSPRYNLKQYRISEEDETMVHRVAPVESEYSSYRNRHDRQDREVSPKTHHRGSDHRPVLSKAFTTARLPSRGASINIPEQSASSRPPLSRSESTRPPPPSSRPSSKTLYGEVPYSRTLAEEDISYARRPSHSSPRDRGPDEYPYQRHSRPVMGDSRGSFVHRDRHREVGSVR
ncbi:MAG: hypothetical protein Q9187_005317, partial [Circinaria calcarea]